MFIIILGYLLTLYSGLITNITTSYCLTPKYSRHKSLFLFSCITAFLVFLKTICGSPAIVIVSILTQLSLLVYLLVCFTEPVWKKILLYFLCIVTCNLSAEFLALIVLRGIFGISINIDRTTPAFLLLSTCICILLTILDIILYIFWWHFTNKESSFSPTLITICILLFSLAMLALLAGYLFLPMINDFSELLLALILFSIAITGAVLFLITLERQKKEKVEAALTELQRLYKLESEEYMALEERSEELSRIRHDINNQLITIEILLKSGKQEEAERFAEELLQHINQS